MICADCGEDACRCQLLRDIWGFEPVPAPHPPMPKAARDRFAAAHAKAREGDPTPPDMVIVKGHPDYGVTPAGEVWRLTPTPNHHRYPRRINLVYLGGKDARYPHARFYDGDKPTVRSISRLLREHFPQNA